MALSGNVTLEFFPRVLVWTTRGPVPVLLSRLDDDK